ncbi:MAG: A24 family peptidase C-terminal domain-containing protein [Candidatus ainarchaeum sp.]|nr:A24 family peptidase C-terminal domain-containing protein [Candidatus ainarchaeum sp.]
MFLDLVFSYLPYILVFIALAIGSYTDLKTRDLHNWLTFGLIILGILFWIAKSIYVGQFLYWPLLIGLITFFVCYLLWYFAVFAGGDAKLIAGVAFCIPYQDFSIFFNGGINPYFIPLFFVLGVFIVFPLGFFLALKRIIVNKHYKIILRDLVKKLPGYLEVAVTLVGLYYIFSLLHIPTIFALLSFLLFKINWKIRLPIAIIVFAISIYLNPLRLVDVLIYVLISVIFFSFIKLFGFVRSKEFADLKKVSKLKEGDILYSSIYIKDNALVKKPTIKDMFKNIKNKDILQKTFESMKSKNYDTVIQTRPAGLYNEEIVVLKKLQKDKVIPAEIYVKQSVPLTPALFLSYIVLLFIGGLL